ncbi:MAG: hypothetical protein A2275_00960 [Bacteroidetes bacterium RIFOXYA12_FULL_35_11]|nr:MAG: hypothetical protein A2X01_05380 [Bacteroidetes bacterium GWF2_35_48]OFY74453.1 MAG: hypothetical protein A2275_00960 [Bacteroidetes bacterium RIFOXYA12_FULL_35_11]OFY95729.1 MAG: hypothetical protein A2491_08660 [Bacteroidetes bacterium RIFOXYC12_FULL_35_7]HBX52186.1 hypothetical protein [Bacteroidales bacterium]
MKSLENNLDIDEITFEKRNKEYGAYDLRKNYKKRMILSVFVAVGFLMLSVGTPFILANINQGAGFEFINNQTVTVDLIDNPNDEPSPPPEPPPPPPPDKSLEKAVKFEAPKVVDDSEADDEIMSMDDISENLKNENIEPDYDDQLDIKPENNALIDDSEMAPPLTYAEEMPAFPGSDDALMQFIGNNIIYPQEAKEMNIQGKVYIYFVVNKKGKVEDVRLERGVDPLLDNEALRVIKLLPDFAPGKMGGHPVKISLIVPIKFTLAP